MTPELTAAVARLETLEERYILFSKNQLGREDAAALRLVLAAVTPREGAEDRVGNVWPAFGPFKAACAVFSVTGSVFADVYGRTEAEALARARLVAQVASREGR